jgi:hypothetical protein
MSPTWHHYCRLSRQPAGENPVFRAICGIAHATNNVLKNFLPSLGFSAAGAYSGGKEIETFCLPDNCTTPATNLP